jgi:hypothetical protein
MRRVVEEMENEMPWFEFYMGFCFFFLSYILYVIYVISMSRGVFFGCGNLLIFDSMDVMLLILVFLFVFLGLLLMFSRLFNRNFISWKTAVFFSFLFFYFLMIFGVPWNNMEPALILSLN